MERVTPRCVNPENFITLGHMPGWYEIEEDRPLWDRLSEIARLSACLEHQLSENQLVQKTGFFPYDYKEMKRTVMAARSILPRRANVFELGCGIGAFTSMSVCAGFCSYGIDCNPFLIECEREQENTFVKQILLDCSVPCAFAVGNIHQGIHYTRYRTMSEELRTCGASNRGNLPLENCANPYDSLGISLDEADLIYAYLWPEHMPFFCEFLRETTRMDATYVLPLYNWRAHRSILPFSVVGGTAHTPLYRRMTPSD